MLRPPGRDFRGGLDVRSAWSGAAKRPELAAERGAPLVRITGVGFFEYIHGQRGVAPNGIELHSALDVEFP